MLNIKNTLNNLKKYADLKVIGDNIQIELKENIKVSLVYIQKLINDLKENKTEAMLILQNHKSENYLLQARKYALNKNYLVSNDIYCKQLTRNSYIIIDFLNEQWEAYRLTYDNYNNIKSEKDILTDDDLINVINRAEKYIYNYLSFIRKAS